MLLKRDIAAVLFAALLVQMAWNRQDLLSASVFLSFYISNPIHGPAVTLLPSVMDLDGDDQPDTLVHILKEQNDDAWKIRVSDIQSKHSKEPPGMPFQPATVLESDPILASDIHPKVRQEHEAAVVPLRMTTGHVRMRGAGVSKFDHQWSTMNDVRKAQASKKTEPSDRSRKMFCGSDWHDAAAKCKTHCPSGSSSDCPEGERCFADTPCDSKDLQPTEEESDSVDNEGYTIEMESLLTDMKNVSRTYHLSPVGGLPSVVTLWSTGVVTMHSLTATRAKSSRSKPSDDPLTVQLMWKTSVFPEKFTVLEWIESAVSFVDGIDSGNGNGLIVVNGVVEGFQSDTFEEDDEEIASEIVATIHARTGKIVWRSFLNDADLDTAPAVLPLHRGTTSAARRRSLIPNLHHHSRGDLVAGSQEVQNCLQSSFRRAFLTSSSLTGKGALPTSYWTEDDASARVLHFNLEQPTPHQLHDKKGEKDKDKSQKRHKHKRQPLHGQPNVLVTHNMEGLQVRSLKNGRSLCHLGLAEEALYADVNHDGALDSIQIALGTHSVEGKVEEDGENPVSYDADDDIRFISELARKVSRSQQKQRKSDSKDDDSTDEESPAAAGNVEASLCHLVALSGFPSREELYSANLCGGAYGQVHPNVAGAAPLLVEPRDSSRKGYDIIAAVNTGFVHRLNGRTGRRQWQLVGDRYRKSGNSLPHWEIPDRTALSRVDGLNIEPSMRPILLVGEDGVAIISSQDGQIMASASFPQPSLQRPVLVDFNGDGTTDVIIQSKDAIWGFEIIVVTGSTFFLRIFVGLLFAGLLLALLSNRFGPRPGKRGSDL